MRTQDVTGARSRLATAADAYAASGVDSGDEDGDPPPLPPIKYRGESTFSPP